MSLPRQRPWRCLAPAGLLALLGFCGVAAAIGAESERYSEDTVKAVFLYRFTAFVDWPADKPGGPVFEIAVLDADGVADALQRVLSDHTVKGLPGRVRRIRSVAELGGAAMLYDGSHDAAALTSVVRATAQTPVLVVSDLPHGLDLGSTINFLLIDHRVRFEVSLSAANRAGLKVSAELLAVATRVAGGADGDAEHRVPATMAHANGE